MVLLSAMKFTAFGHERLSLNPIHTSNPSRLLMRRAEVGGTIHTGS